MLKALHHHQNNIFCRCWKVNEVIGFFLSKLSLHWLGEKYQPWVMTKEKNASWSCLQPLGANFKSCLRYYKNDSYLLAGHAYFEGKAI
ncbi:MAG: DUF2509 family protein, partial [Arsenophonus sp.]|nr:DUF2509 family protein [Arsenophonus sp.]